MTTPPTHIKLTKEICTELLQFKQLRKSNNELQRKINLNQEKLSNGSYQDIANSQEDGTIDSEYSALREMYLNALKQSEKEQE